MAFQCHQIHVICAHHFALLLKARARDKDKEVFIVIV